MSSKHMKRYLAQLANVEIQFRTTRSHSHTLHTHWSLYNIKRCIITSVGENVVKLEPHTLIH